MALHWTAAVRDELIDRRQEIRLTVDQLLNELPLQILKKEAGSTTFHSFGTSSFKILLQVLIS
jgi:hypothetical protein